MLRSLSRLPRASPASAALRARLPPRLPARLGSPTSSPRPLPATRSFSSTPKPFARYVKFSPDPERPLDVSRWNTGTKVVAGLAVCGGVYYVSHLERVPETGRLRFMDASATFETRMAAETHQELLREFNGRILPPNHRITREIERVVTRILDANNLGSLKNTAAPVGMVHTPDLERVLQPGEDMWSDGKRDGKVSPESGGREWHLVVVDDPKIVNAMASFGNVVVFTGILPVCKDEDGLAAVLGHEIGHVVLRHNAERYSSMKVLLAICLLLETTGLDIGIARLLTTFLMELPNSRTAEHEADAVGLRLAARACFRPDAAPEMFARLGEAEKNKRFNVDFLYTHPTGESRVKRLKEKLPEAYQVQAASECGRTGEMFGAFRNAFGGGVGGAFGGGPIGW